jgi:hypothetical protein
MWQVVHCIPALPWAEAENVSALTTNRGASAAGNIAAFP